MTILLFTGHVIRSFIASSLIAILEACLPLSGGIILANVAVQDASLELLLTLPVMYRRIAFLRLILILLWTLLIEFLATLALYWFLPWVPAKPLGSGQLTWLAGAGILLSLLLCSRASTGGLFCSRIDV